MHRLDRRSSRVEKQNTGTPGEQVNLRDSERRERIEREKVRPSELRNSIVFRSKCGCRVPAGLERP